MTSTNDTIINLLQISPIMLSKQLSLQEFTALTELIPDLPIEREKNGQVTVFSPKSRVKGKIESIVNTYIGWTRLAN